MEFWIFCETKKTVKMKACQIKILLFSFCEFY